MLFEAPSPQSYSHCGYAPARTYHGVAIPCYADVAAASPSAGPFAELSVELDNVMLDCHKSGWDGYGAKAISLDAYRIARRFIYSLPAGVPRPSLSADPDGCVTFEWQLSPRRLVLVSVHPDYRIDYAALFGSAKSYGTEPFFDRLPVGIFDLVRRVYQA